MIGFDWDRNRIMAIVLYTVFCGIRFVITITHSHSEYVCEQYNIRNIHVISILRDSNYVLQYPYRRLFYYSNAFDVAVKL